MRKFFILLFSLAPALIGCAQTGDGEAEKGRTASSYKADAMEMVEEQLIARGIEDERVLDAMKEVPRHRFVASEYRDKAYGDHPLPIEEGQTISQPYVVARMSELLELEGNEKLLEIGTGSGYQAAILGKLARELHSVEIRPALVEEARALLEELGHTNIHVHEGNGYEGWEEEAPYDGIIVTAAPKEVPEALKEQLTDGGRLVIPVGEGLQKLKVLEKEEGGRFGEKNVSSVQFVPMVRDTSK